MLQLEKRVREHAGDTEPAWKSAGARPGVEVWRIEQFQIVPREVNGEFYDGDSYIVLHVSVSDCWKYDTLILLFRLTKRTSIPKLCRMIFTFGLGRKHLKMRLAQQRTRPSNWMTVSLSS